MRVEQVIGMRIRDRREAQEMTQEQLGQRVGEMLGREWSRQAISTAERGGRAFTAAELVVIAHVLGTSVARILTPPISAQAIELAAGTTLTRDEMVAAVIPQIAPLSIFDEMRQQITAASESLQVADTGNSLAIERIRSLGRLLEMASQVASMPPGAMDAAMENEATP